MQHIFLLGHRKTAGKDASTEILKTILDSKKISYHHEYFAKKLKEQAADKYGLNFNSMGDDKYKNSRPEHLNGLSVRDVLIKEGCGARAIWENVWAFPVYRNLMNSGTSVGIISDFRYPNEYSCFDECFKLLNITGELKKPKLIKVLVHRPDGKFVCDGADDQLPDINPYWDFVIMNDDKTNNWKQNIQRQLKTMVESIIGV